MVSMLIGLTGGIAAGKSTVSARLAAHGLYLIDADVLAREAVEPGSAGLASIARHFGPGVLAADGSLDRPALGARVFADQKEREALGRIVHPEVRRLFRERLREIHAKDPEAIVVHDVPLLVENRMQGDYHLVVVVHAPASERLRRLVEDRGMDEEQARQRIAAQATDEERAAAADVILDNSGSRQDLERQVDALVHGRIRTGAAALAARRRRLEARRRA